MSICLYFVDNSVNPDDKTAAELRKFNAHKSQWSRLKCSEIQEILALFNQQYPLTFAISNLTQLNGSARLLCAGPKFDAQQAQQFTFYLQQMQTIFTNTEICLPKQFDICLNLDRIWDVTYFLNGAHHLEPLCLDAVRPNRKLLVARRFCACGKFCSFSVFFFTEIKRPNCDCMMATFRKTTISTEHRR